MEKACVHEYTLPQLARAVQRSRHLFRPYLLVVVRQVLDQFARPGAEGEEVHAAHARE